MGTLCSLEHYLDHFSLYRMVSKQLEMAKTRLEKLVRRVQAEVEAIKPAYLDKN